MQIATTPTTIESPIEGTWILEETLNCTSRYLVLQGGTRSSKTYSVMQSFATRLFTPSEYGARMDVVRKTMPSLRGSAMVDFFEILHANDLYNPDWHNKSQNEYVVPHYDTKVSFLGLDQAQKIRGRGRDRLFANEANELTEEDFLQLRVRTRKQLIFDYNPSDQFHWIYEKVLPRDDCTIFNSTYIDNPYLPQSLVDEIESLKDMDPDYWQVYGLGKRGVNQATIFPLWEFEEEFPDDAIDPVYGLDIGFTNQTALVQVVVNETRDGKDELVWDQLLYERRLTDDDLIARFDALGIIKHRPMYVDSSSVQTIENLQRAGYNAGPSDKSVGDGIKSVKSYKLRVTKRSSDLQKELRAYRFKVDRDNRVLEDPVKFRDHAIDAGRYATHSHFGERGGESWIVE